MDSSQITDLRTALDFLAERPGQLVSTDVEVDPYLEIAGIYRKVGSGTPTAPPTQIGPAMLFNKVKGSDMAGSGRHPGQPGAYRPPSRQ